LDQFASTADGPSMLAAGRHALIELGKIPVLLKWNQGLRPALYDLVLKTVAEAERFGSGSGVLKRRFAVDLVSRILRDYEPSPLFELVEDVTTEPYVGVLVDWTVEVLNVQDAWPPVTRIKIPGFYSGRYGVLLRLQGWLWRLITAVRTIVTFPSAYERNLRDALRKIDPQVQALKTALPPSTERQNLDAIATIIAKVGRLTAPHVRMAVSLLKMADSIAQESPEERRQLAHDVLKILLERAFADNWLVLNVIDSSIGDSLITEIVRSTDWVLAQNGLLPSSQNTPAARYSARGQRRYPSQ
jgi:hypothetical protein